MQALNSDTIAVFQEITHQQAFGASSGDSVLANALPVRQFVTETRQQPLDINPKEIRQFSLTWQLSALMLAIILLALLNVTQKRFFKHLSAAFYSRPLFKQLMRDGQLFPASTLFISFLAIILVYSLLIFQAHQYFVAGRTISSAAEYEQLVGFTIFVGSFLLAKNLLHFFVGVVFGLMAKTREYLGNSFYFNTVFCITLIPFLAAYLLSQHILILYITLVIALVVWIVKSYRGFLIAFEIERFSRFQFFVYFCALEILPVLVGFNLIVVKGILN